MNEVLHKIKRNVLWELFSLLPKQPGKAVCQSFYGRGWSDSPAAVGEELRKRGYTVCWVVKGEQEANSLPEGVKPLLLDSAAAIYHQCTAGVWVDSCRKWAYTKKRGRQLYIQTWHGFPLKRIEKDAEKALPEDYIRAARQDSRMADLFVSNSRFLTEIYQKGFWYDGEVLECGFPRNDILAREHPDLESKVRRALSLPEDKKLLLYAPTFRKDKGVSVFDVDFSRCARALGNRFGGEWTVLLKLHPNIAGKAAEIPFDPEVVKNASEYPDIQELYLASDALLTDYSSVMFDYMATRKPCFLYVNDLEAYRGDRNFYFDLQKLPYLLTEDNDGLEQAIRSFDEEEQAAREEQFREEFGVQETGHAAQAVADWIEQRQKI